MKATKTLDELRIMRAYAYLGKNLGATGKKRRDDRASIERFVGKVGRRRGQRKRSDQLQSGRRRGPDTADAVGRLRPQITRKVHRNPESVHRPVDRHSTASTARSHLYLYCSRIELLL